MYVISDETNNKPYAIITIDSRAEVEFAIREENIFNKAALTDEIDFENLEWGQETVIDYLALNEDNELVSGSVLITKIVSY